MTGDVHVDRLPTSGAAFARRLGVARLTCGAQVGHLLGTGDVTEGTTAGPGTRRSRCVAAPGPEPGGTA